MLRGAGRIQSVQRDWLASPYRFFAVHNELRQQAALRHRGDRIAGQIALNCNRQFPPEILERRWRQIAFEFEQETATAEPLDEAEVEIRKAGKVESAACCLPDFMEMECAATLAKLTLAEMRSQIGHLQEIERGRGGKP
jgi:hypothetical protein